MRHAIEQQKRTAPSFENVAEPSENAAARREALDRLRVALWKYALTHQGRFPASDSVPEIPEKAWQMADPSGLHFVYRPGLKADEGAAPLAYEPGLFGPDRWVLLTDGTLEKLPIGAIRALLPRSEEPARQRPEPKKPEAGAP